MASTYVNNLRLNEMATGDASGTWGDTTNTNLELIGEALGFGTEAITTNADTHTSTIADGASDAGSGNDGARAMYLKYTGTLDSACTITIAPNDIRRLQFIENGTSGAQNIIISQGSGANVTIPPGDTKAVYLDGAGSGAAVVDAFASLSVVDLKVQDDLTVTDDLIVNGDIDLEGSIDVNGTMEADAITIGGTAIASVLSPIAGSSSLTTTGALNSGSITSGFGTIDTGSSSITTTGAVTGGSLDINGNADISGELTMGGNIDLQDNDKLMIGTGDDLQIYHSGSHSYIADGGTGNLYVLGTEIRIGNGANDKSFMQMDDGGEVRIYYNNSEKLNTKTDGVDITGELQCDSLDVDGDGNISGTLTMGGNIDMQDSDQIKMGTGDDLLIQHNGSNSLITHNGTGHLYIKQSTNDADIYIQSDNGSGGETNYILCDGSAGEVRLFHYGSEKLNTASDGIYVTGNVQSSAGRYEGASNADRIMIGASDIDFYINGSNEFRMQSDGDFHADADVIAYSTTVSDERLKTDIEKIENATDKISQLNGYTFTYKADGVKSAGVIAQEVEKVLPSAVREKELPLKTDDGVAYKTVQYDQIIGLLIESIKELKQEINELKGV